MVVPPASFATPALATPAPAGAWSPALASPARAPSGPPSTTMPGSAAALAGPLRVAVVCDVCSLRLGGEAAIPFHYFRLLRQAGIDAHLVAHARNGEELTEAFAADADRLHLVGDGVLHRLLHRLGGRLSAEVSRATTRSISRLYTQFLHRRILRRLVRERGVNVIHQPTPVSPAEPSLLWDCGAPLVVGPMNGGIEYPPAFRRRAHPADRLAVRLARLCGWWANRLIPGKHRAQLLLAANARTDAAIARYAGSAPVRLVENGVDLSLWRPPQQPRRAAPGRAVRFAFCGRLVGWKGVDLLLRAWATLPPGLPAELLIIGDGPARAALEDQCRRLHLDHAVRFAGWLTQPECARELAAADVLVHPSLRESGGSCVLEAMACALPVIACDWGGPADYLDPDCGVLVPPTGPQQFVAGLAEAIVRLAESEPLRHRMGEAAREKVTRHFSWDAKVARVVELYRAAMSAAAAAAAAPAAPAEVDDAGDTQGGGSANGGASALPPPQIPRSAPSPARLPLCTAARVSFGVGGRR